jgi:hypothetical protein
MRMTEVFVAARVRGFGGIAGLDGRSVRVLVHPWKYSTRSSGVAQPLGNHITQFDTSPSGIR